MKPAIKKNAPLLIALFAIVLTIGLVSWGQKQSGDRYQHSQNDTTPKKKSDRDKKVRDLDDVLDELNEADFNFDMRKVQEELAEAMKKFDADKIKMDIDLAMKDLDLAKIQKEVEESLAKVDFNKIKEELAQAMKELDVARIQQELQESMAKVDWDKMKEEMKRFKEVDMKKFEVDMKKMQEEMKDLGPKMEKEMAHAKEEIEKVKTGIREFKSFVNDLEKDGLLKKDSYTLKHQDGELFINGKKATEEVYNKYRNFLEKHKKFNIEKSDDDFDMDLD